MTGIIDSQLSKPLTTHRDMQYNIFSNADNRIHMREGNGKYTTKMLRDRVIGDFGSFNKGDKISMFVNNENVVEVHLNNEPRFAFPYAPLVPESVLRVGYAFAGSAHAATYRWILEDGTESSLIGMTSVNAKTMVHSPGKVISKTGVAVQAYAPTGTFTASLGSRNGVPAQTYQFAIAHVGQLTGSYSAVMRQSCANLGMKPVCDYPGWCKTDTTAIYLGQDHHISYPPHRNHLAYFPSGWSGIKANWNGKCMYAASAYYSRAICNGPNTNTHQWRTRSQGPTSFVCARVYPGWNNFLGSSQKTFKSTNHREQLGGERGRATAWIEELLAVVGVPTAAELPILGRVVTPEETNHNRISKFQSAGKNA
jgi:hypothetical protein